MAQKFYDKALTIGLKGYAQLHQTVISRRADWEGIEKSRSVRDFNNYATRVLGKYETVDAYYRQNNSTNFVGNVMVPLLCNSALDDPICTREAIPWDECSHFPSQEEKINKCKLLHWEGTNLVVAEGQIASRDPKSKVHHVTLGPLCWKVWVNHITVNVPLFRSSHEMYDLQDAIGSTVADLVNSFFSTKY